jgi:hypothetical protein
MSMTKPNKEPLILPIEIAIFNKRKEWFHIPITVHMTRDYFLKIKASGELHEMYVLQPGFNIDSPTAPPTINGYPVVIHEEPCESDWWLACDEGPKPVSGFPYGPTRIER